MDFKKIFKNKFYNKILIRDISLCFILLAVLLLDYFHIYENIYLLISVTFLGVLPIFISAFISIKDGEWASMDMLASIALLFSILSKQWSSAIFITLMITSARILEELNEVKAKKSIVGLLKLKPKTARVKRMGKVEIIQVEEIKIGDIIIVDIGERIPIDGLVVEGEATVDESSLTGESLPVEKERGSKVSSSTLVTSGSLLIKTEKIGKDTTLEKIIALVQDAREQKPEVEQIGSKFGKVYLISVFIGSALLIFFTKDVYFVLAIVLVVCADDIAIAIPIAYLRAISFAASKGIIIKGGKHLEMMGKIDTIVFDKTGTLTTGKPVLVSLEVEEPFIESDLLSNALLAAIRSAHPVAQALVQYCNKKDIPTIYPDSATVLGGKGIIAQKDGKNIIIGNKILFDSHQIKISEHLNAKAIECSERGESVSYVSVEKKLIGFFSVSDIPKPNAVHTVQELYKIGIKRIIMLTGDNEKVASFVANKIGIKDFYANLLPEDKVEKIKEIQKTGKVVMIGDGVNDASALSISHVGIAMGALGSDGAIESAEIVLMHDDLSAIPKIIKIARKVHKIAKQDFWIWGFTNVLGLSLVFGGFIGHTGAAAYNFISDFFPLLNSTRAKIKS